MNQRKHCGSDEQLFYKRWPEETTTTDVLDEEVKFGDAGGKTAWSSKSTLKHAARAYWMEGVETARKLGRLGAAGVNGDPLNNLGGYSQKLCLFKLSDLCMWKAFPTFLLKRGFTIWL